MQNKLVRDLMVPIEDYPCIPDTLTIGDSIAEMTVQIARRGGRLSLPRVALVFDEDFSKLLGMLRRRDIMRGLEPAYMGGGPLKYARKLFDIEVDPNLSELSYDTLITGIRKRSRRLAKDYMSPIKAVIQHDDHMMKAMCEMVEHNTSLLPVIEKGNVVGVIASVDVLSEIALVI